jgi:urease accessory protein
VGGGSRSGVDAVARIRAVSDGRGGTVLRELVGDGPLALRRSRHPDDDGAAHVVLVGAMAAPLGGDRLRVEVRVEPGARLLVTSAAATLSLPGRDPAPAHYELGLSVDARAELTWLPEPVIAAARSSLRLWTRVRLAPGARLHLREEQVLGRYGEPPGRLCARLTVRQQGRLVLDQTTDVGTGAPPGWDGPAVLGGHRALGQLLTTRPCAPLPTAGSAVFPLGDGLTLLTTVAADARALRTALVTSLPTALSTTVGVALADHDHPPLALPADRAARPGPTPVL